MGTNMAIKLKPLSEQVMVILGASSGIGRETARRAAARGAILVVAARNQDGLASLVEEITAAGGKAVPVVCDVTDEAQVRQVARDAMVRFGRIDSWVNVAGVSVYAGFEDTTPEEFRRILEVNFMGYVHGAQAALPYLREHGGALIVISSVESIVSLPLHSAYAASKHAIEGAFDALRRELMAEGAPVSVTSIKPATINTPFFTNSRSKLDVVPKGPPPFYDPAVVADCVLYAAEHPVRDLFAGGAGRSMAMSQAMTPGLMDATLARFGIPASKTERPAPDGRPGNLYTSGGDDRARGDFTDRSRSSLYTWLALRPLARSLAVGAVVTGAVLVGRSRRMREDRARTDADLLAQAAFADRKTVDTKPMGYPPVRPAGPEAMRDPSGRPWTVVDEASDESFPASDPPATY
jgi:NAD(P)-dependent dehydrogenase (short-subunit alcohol dehydrogenase family)